MEYKILEENGVENKNVDGGAFNNFCAGGQSGIIAGVLDECKITTVSNVITIGTGLLLLNGIRVKLTAPTDISLTGTPAIPTDYLLVAKVELFADETIKFNIETRTSEVIAKDELYKQDKGVYELVLARFTHSNNGAIENLTQVANIITASDIKNIEDKFSNLEKDIKNNIEQFKNNQTQQVLKNTNKIKAVENALIQVGTISKRNGLMTVETQETGGGDLTGLTILDNSYATVNKISGNTVASRNLFNISKIVSVGSCINNGDGTLSITTRTATSGKNLEDVCPGLNAGDTIRLSMKTDSDAKYIQVSNTIIGTGTTVVVTETMLKSRVFFFGYSSTSAQAGQPCTISNIQIEKGETVTPYMPYFSGLKNAQISGIKSTGRNLLSFPYEYLTTSGKEKGLTWVTNSDGSITLNGTLTEQIILPLGLLTKDNLPKGTYFFSNGANYIEFFNNGIYVESKNATNSFVEIDYVNYDSIKVFLSPFVGIEYVNSVFYPQVNYGASPLPFAKYVQPSIMTLPKTVELGKWDYIKDGKVVKATQTMVLTGSGEQENWYVGDTEESGIYRIIISNPSPSILNEGGIVCNMYETVSGGNTWSREKGIAISGQLVTIYDENFNTDDISLWKAHLADLYAKGTPLIIAYQMENPTEEDISFDNKYLVWNNGTETVETPKDESGYTCFDYGANTTEENEYIILLGGAE